MQWIHQIQLLLHTIGWRSNSKLNPETWQYALFQGFKLAKIDIVPGVYAHRLSYANLRRLRFDLHNATSPRTQPSLLKLLKSQSIPNDLLGFVLPLQLKLPIHIETIYSQYMAKTTSHKSDKLNELMQKQLFIRRIFEAIDLLRTYDKLLVITASILALRSPLPAAAPDLRDKQWNDLMWNGHKVEDAPHYCLNFIIVGMYQRYKDLQVQRPDEASFSLFRSRNGMYWMFLKGLTVETFKITSLLFEKVHLARRKNPPCKRAYPRWTDMDIRFTKKI